MSAKDKDKGTGKKADKKKEEEPKKMPISLDPPSGTRDFFPEEMRQQRWLFDKFRDTARAYGFEEYDAPVLEHEELYKRKAGEEITQQMYNFVDKDGAAVTLRPEMTPSLARMVLSLMRIETGDMAKTLPLKWYSVPQCWRYETTQRGRKREHYQWNMDVVGVDSIYAEAELLSAICHFFESVGITSKDVGLKVNSRKVLGAVLKAAGVPDDRFAETCVIIDKQDKIGPEAVMQEMTEKVGLSAEVGRKIVAATAAKTLDEFAAVAGVGESAEVAELRRLFELSVDYGYGDWLQFDASVVRGLAYYTGVVFEGFDKAGVLRAICGGGRYDRLLTLYGSPKQISCVGFGFGDCVIVELLREKGVMPQFPPRVDFVVAAYNQDMIGKAMNVARRMRLAGKSVDLYSETAKKVAKAFNYADKVGAVKVAFVAPDEWAKGLVRIKDLRSYGPDAPDELKQKDVPLDDLANVDVHFGQVPTPAAQAAAAAAPRALAAPTPAACATAPPATAAVGPKPAPGAKAAAAGAKAATASGATAAAAPAAAKATPAAAADTAAGFNLAELEEHLLDYPYVQGFKPSRRDYDLFEDLQRAGKLPKSQGLGRWFEHMQSFTRTERMGWS